MLLTLGGRPKYCFNLYARAIASEDGSVFACR